MNESSTVCSLAVSDTSKGATCSQSLDVGDPMADRIVRKDARPFIATFLT